MMTEQQCREAVAFLEMRDKLAAQISEIKAAAKARVSVERVMMGGT